MTSLPNQRDNIPLDEIRRPSNITEPQENIPMSTRRDSEESLKSETSVFVESVNSGRMEPKRDRRDFIIGLLLLLVVVVLWTSSNFITQDLFEEGFDKPFLVTYLNTAAFSFYLLPFLYRYWRHGTTKVVARHEYEPLANEPGTDTLQEQEEALIVPSTEENLPPLTMRETAMLAGVFCVLWFVANWSVNASLRYTSVGSSTVLASTSGLFTMVVGRLLGIESLTIWKIAAVVGSFVGVALVSLADSAPTHPKTNPPPSSTLLPPPSNPLLGDALALLSAAFYAFYLSLLKVKIRTESRIDMQLFFGFVGLFSILSCWPIGVLLHVTGVETFGWPVGGKEWAGIAVNMAVTFSSDFIYVIAMLKTTPLVVTLGLTLTIPLAILGDLILQSRGVTLVGLCGAILVVAAFAVIGFEDSKGGGEQDIEPVVRIPGEEPISASSR